MPRISRADALEDISTWGTADVVALLQKNGVEEACWKAAEKRQIDGDELLHLTEGKLALWKSDLTRPLIWSLWTFVEELKKCPENYLEAKEAQQQAELALPSNQQVDIETLSDTGSWDTDFEDSVDDPAEENNSSDMRVTNVVGSNPDFRNNLRMFQENDRIRMQNNARESAYLANHAEKANGATSPENTYANCEPVAQPAEEVESTYANIGFAEPTTTTATTTSTTPSISKNTSHLYPSVESQKSFAEKLQEQLLLMNSKPALVPKPEALSNKIQKEATPKRSEPRMSFLHNNAKSKVNGANATPKKMNVPPPSKPTDKSPHNQNRSEETIRNLPKPPVTIRGFDLVANLPTTRPTDESEDEEESYEAFDEQIVEQHQRNSMIRADSGQSLSSARHNSVESVYHPPSLVSHEEEEVYEIYESITESPEDKEHDFKNDSNSKNLKNPPPLPAKPPPNITTLQNQLNKTDTKAERSLEKKSATLPHTGSNSSLNNAARPLPPPPDKQSYYDRPWFHNLTRDQANLLIEEQCTYGNSPDGYFLMRPSTSNPNNPLTLVLWCKDRVYNVHVRRRPDNRYALGLPKPDEQSFASIDEIIPFYKKEKLVLYTGGVQTGSTRLSDTPPK